MFGYEDRYKLFMKLPQGVRSRMKTLYQRVSALGYFYRFTTQRARGVRILGIVDFNEEGFGIGDGLTFHVFLNILRIQYNAAKIDTCYIDDPTHKNARREGYARTEYLKQMLSSLHEFNPYAGSHFHFDSNAQFAEFITRFRDKYIIWPLLHGEVKYKGLYDMKRIMEFYQRNGYLPRISCSQERINWAHSFREKYTKGEFLIAVHLRNNRTRRTDKNSHISAWKQFFKKYAQDERFMFVIIGTQEEIVPELRACANVIFSKDYGTSLAQDFALTQIAYLSLMSTSGPGVFPRFAGLPGLTFGLNPLYTCEIPQGTTYPFLTPYQKVFWGKESFELIDHEFQRLFSQLQENNWKNPYSFKKIFTPKHNF